MQNVERIFLPHPQPCLHAPSHSPRDHRPASTPLPLHPNRRGGGGKGVARATRESGQDGRGRDGGGGREHSKCGGATGRRARHGAGAVGGGCRDAAPTVRWPSWRMQESVPPRPLPPPHTMPLCAGHTLQRHAVKIHAGSCGSFSRHLSPPTPKRRWPTGQAHPKGGTLGQTVGVGRQRLPLCNLHQKGGNTPSQTGWGVTSRGVRGRIRGPTARSGEQGGLGMEKPHRLSFAESRGRSLTIVI